MDQGIVCSKRNINFFKIKRIKTGNIGMAKEEGRQDRDGMHEETRL